MSTDLPNFAQLLREQGIQPKKSLGQNFLFDTNIINQIIDLAGITPETPVLEIGAGPGNLTRALAARAKTGRRGRARPTLSTPTGRRRGKLSRPGNHTCQHP